MLLDAFLNRVPIHDPRLRVEQLFVVTKSAHLLIGMLQISIAHQWLATTLSVLDLSQVHYSSLMSILYRSHLNRSYSQLMTQAMWQHQSPLLQLPHVEPDQLNRNRRLRDFKSLIQLRDMDDAARR